LKLRGNITDTHRFILCVSSCFLAFSAPLWATSPDHKQFKSLTQMIISADREPVSGAVRTNKAQSDLRSVFESPDSREVSVTIWSPRVHPFKEPPQYKSTRTCYFGEYFETTIGISDVTKANVLRKSGRETKFAHAFEWNENNLSLSPIQPPETPPQQFDFIGKIFENEKTGICEYQPVPIKENENAKLYFYKHLQIALKANVTDISFPKTTFNFINLSKQDFSSDYNLTLSGLKDLNIDFNGSTFLLPPKSGGFLLRNNQRLAVRKLSLEWAMPDEKDGKGYNGPSLHGFFAPKSSNSDLWFEAISLKRVPGWAFHFDTVRGALISNSIVSSVPNDTLPAGKDGAVRAINSQDLVIRNNSFSNLGGDGISIHGQFAVVSSLAPSNTSQNEEKQTGSCVGIGSYFGQFAKDETMGFFNSKMGFMGEMPIKKIEHFSMTDSNLPEYCRGFAFCSQACFNPHPEFSPTQAGFVASATQNSSLFIVYGNTLSDIKGRAIIVQGSNGDISENIITRSGGPGIQLTADLANQLQGPGAYNIVLKNNRLHQVASGAEVLRPTEPVYGGLAIAATHRESDGRILLSPAPLIQNIRIEGVNSLVENAGSVALQIASAKQVDVRALSIGTAGTSRNLSSGSLSGDSAEGSVLVTRSTHVDLSGLSSPALSDSKMVRNRTIVVDSQYTSNIVVPVTTRGVSGKTANTLWYTTLRSWFKNNPKKDKYKFELQIESPRFSSSSNQLPLEAYPITLPKLGDKELASIGDAIPLTNKSGQLSSSFDLSWPAPHRIQLRPKTNPRILDLSLSIERIHFAPKKLAPLPYES